ncbi:MAG TPA: hypothetical protein VGZ90_12530 [Puia sp.]|jgi:hypothetical protein|nr:hypothetical protein [Puia sp.]
MNLINRKNLLLFSLAAETFLASYGLLIGEQTNIVSILYLIAGLIFIFSILILPIARLPRVTELKKESLLKLPLLVCMLLLAFITSRYWLDLIPLDPDFADMLPVMKVMNERFLHGEWKHVYDGIPEIWNGTRPIYLPAMWLPYLPAIALNIDMRWITVVLVILSFIIVLILIRIKKNKYFGYGLIAISGLLFWWIFSRNEVHSLISMSEEGVVIFYFVLLSLAIISGNAFFMGLTASLCLLSRYSMIGWLVPCLIFFAARKDFRKLIVFSFTGIFCFLLFFLVPFGFKTMDQMIALPGNYVAFAKHIWEFTPEVYWLNLGLAKFYGPHRMAILHYSLLIMSFGIPLLFMCFCLLQKKWRFNNINLACFKLSLLVFYQFIDVPYGYLFYTSSFVSLVIATSILSVEVW